MVSFLSSVTGRNATSLFDIRYVTAIRIRRQRLTYHHSLENDFIVFRGNEHESAGQMVKGVVVLCVPTPLRMEDLRLRLTGTLRVR